MDVDKLKRYIELQNKQISYSSMRVALLRKLVICRDGRYHRSFEAQGFDDRCYELGRERSSPSKEAVGVILHGTSAVRER